MSTEPSSAASGALAMENQDTPRAAWVSSGTGDSLRSSCRNTDHSTLPSGCNDRLSSGTALPKLPCLDLRISGDADTTISPGNCFWCLITFPVEPLLCWKGLSWLVCGVQVVTCLRMGFSPRLGCPHLGVWTWVATHVYVSKLMFWSVQMDSVFFDFNCFLARPQWVHFGFLKATFYNHSTFCSYELSAVQRLQVD